MTAAHATSSHSALSPTLSDSWSLGTSNGPCTDASVNSDDSSIAVSLGSPDMLADVSRCKQQQQQQQMYTSRPSHSCIPAAWVLPPRGCTAIAFQLVLRVWPTGVHWQLQCPLQEAG
jgi:hypothetical protein